MDTMEFIATMSSDPDARAAWIAAIEDADISCDCINVTDCRISSTIDFVVDGTNLDSVVATMIALRADGLLCENADAALVVAEQLGVAYIDGVDLETIAPGTPLHLRCLAMSCALSCAPADDDGYVI